MCKPGKLCKQQVMVAGFMAPFITVTITANKLELNMTTYSL
jgi:hypothetical protein